MQNNEIGPLSYTINKQTNSNWINNLNVRPETVKLLEENIEKKPHDIGLGNEVLDSTLKAQATKAQISQWDCIKLKFSAQQRKH